jgi:tetratricopeptide (TPR) repeat protein
MTGASNSSPRSTQSPPSSKRKLREAYEAHQAGQLDKAARLYGEILQRQANEFDALHMFGLLNYQRGRHAEALRLIAAALKTHSRSAEAWWNLGLVLQAQGEYAKALASYDEALAIRPGQPDVLNNRGTALGCLGRREAALESFSQSLAARPDNVMALFNRGSTLLELGRNEEALASFDAALALQPDHAPSLCHRGNALLRLNRIADAASTYALAARSAPNDLEVLHNQAFALRALGRPREALVAAERALGVKPDYAPARFEQALALLSLGDLPAGFAAYEARWDTAEFRPQRRDFAQPAWRGEDLQGKTILLHAEQGFGDTLQFARYVPLVARRGASVVLETQRELKTLLSRLDGTASVVARGEPLPSFDLHCPLLSLPHVLRTDLQSIPADVPYIAVDRAAAAVWADRLSTYKAKVKIGLVWAGNPRAHDPNASAIDARRSTALADFAPLADLPDVVFVSLQKGELGAQALEAPPGLRLVDMTAELGDFAATAALVSQLDLVITVDTAAAHLAGALAKPVWILSRYDCCWRWLDRREDSPWYPTARLFHQKAPGAWHEVVARVRQELEQRCTQRERCVGAGSSYR